jgi:hypothetical protein
LRCFAKFLYLYESVQNCGTTQQARHFAEDFNAQVKPQRTSYAAGFAAYIALKRKRVYTTQLLFFGPLAVGAMAIEAIGRLAPPRANLAKHLAAVFAAWAGSAALLYLAMTVVTPQDGLRHMPTLMAAYVAPVLLVATVLPSVKWLRPGRVTFSLAVCGTSALFSPVFLLAATCVFQANCL